MTAEQRIELEALITEREGKIAGNRQHPDDEPHSELEFVYLAKCMRALLIKKENPQDEG